MDPDPVRELAERFRLDLGQRIRALSHGNRQKVGLIQAFMHRPELLVLDEPTTGLDPLMQREFYELIGEARRRQSLDLLLATPVTRRRVVVEKFVAMLLGALLLSAVLWASVAALGPPFDLTPGLWSLAAAVASCYLLAVAFGAVALAVGCATGRRALAIGATGGAAAATYLFDVLAPSVKAVEWLERLSPFHYYRAADPLVNGLDPVHALVLAAIGAVAFALALASLERRDLAA